MHLPSTRATIDLDGKRGSAIFGGLSGITAIGIPATTWTATRRCDCEPPITIQQPAMSMTEALRTQLDALRVEHNALQAENRRLRDKQPDRASEIDLENELEATCEENIRLSQAVTRLPPSKHSGSEKRRCRRTSCEDLWNL